MSTLYRHRRFPQWRGRYDRPDPKHPERDLYATDASCLVEFRDVVSWDPKDVYEDEVRS